MVEDLVGFEFDSNPLQGDMSKDEDVWVPSCSTSLLPSHQQPKTKKQKTSVLPMPHILYDFLSRRGII